MARRVQEPGHGPHTPEKQKDFTTIINRLLPIVRNVVQRPERERWAYQRTAYYQRFVYIDLTAGRGGFDGIDGSPVLVAAAACQLGFPVDMHLCEEHADDLAELQAALAPWQREPKVRMFLYAGDHHETLTDILRYYPPGHAECFGLAYLDPNPCPLDVELLNRIALHPGFGHVDLLAYISAAGGYKWNRPERKSLREDFAAVRKDFAQVRQHSANWQWTFGFWTNWERMPTFKNIRFFLASSAEGQKILRTLDLTKAEMRAEDQPALPFLDSLRTGPIANTFGIPGFGPSGSA